MLESRFWRFRKTLLKFRPRYKRVGHEGDVGPVLLSPRPCPGPDTAREVVHDVFWSTIALCCTSSAVTVYEECYERE